MRITFVLALLLAGSVRPSPAQNLYTPSTPQALPASLTPAASTAGTSLDLALRRNRARGVFVGAVAGGVVAGLLVTYSPVCSGIGGEGNTQAICMLGGVGLGTVLGGVAGWIIGRHDRSPVSNSAF